MGTLSVLLTLLFGLLTGVSLGALGSGGSILALPAFVYAAGVPVKPAVATSLAVVGLSSLAGALMALHRSRTRGDSDQAADVRVAVLFGAGGLVGSFAGARAARGVPDSAQMLVFAVLVVAAATAMLRRRSPGADGSVNGSAVPTGRRLVLIPLTGLGVGLVTGVIGVGGGFMIVPALTLLAGVPIRRATITSLWIIAANSATGVLGYVGRVPFAWDVAAVFLAASLAGMAAGLAIARGAAPRKLQTAFAVFLLVVGAATAVQTMAKHRRPAEMARRAPAAAPAVQAEAGVADR